MAETAQANGDTSKLNELPAEIMPIDLNVFLEKKDGFEKECEKVGRFLHEYGILLVRDPRVSQSNNAEFLDMMEKYFEKPLDKKMKDVHPEVHYQVGATPAHVERAIPRCETFEKFDKHNMPLTLCPPEADPKWRFFWRIGPTPAKTEFPALNADAVIPEDFPQWPQVMDNWGGKMLTAALTISQMAARAFDLPEDSFTSRMNYGPHLLAPTGSDLEEFGKQGTVFANYHKDLNFLTIHGKSRYPGLFVWLRDGRKVLVKVPDDCLLMQAGIQFEWLTGGHVLAGFHEVVVSKETEGAIERRRKAGGSMWRVSSTTFSHIASDTILEPLGQFAKLPDALKHYPPTKAGNQVRDELAKLALANSSENGEK